MHPDNYYSEHASTSNACHTRIAESDSAPSTLRRKKKGREDGLDDSDTTGVYGAPASNCDSPHALINATFDWIKDNLMNNDDDSEGIDFVIWTGDSARHDNDIERPRTEKEILSLNELMAQKMYEVFGDRDGLGDDDPSTDFVIPVVPTLGNNDILPHNIFFPGPSTLTREYLSLWRSFVPEEQLHVFDRGAYFWKGVVPGATTEDADHLQHGGLAVVSLNTLYFFNSNSAVDGCNLPSEPGYQQMEWLRIQLELMRQTNTKAILIGHVPPARVREVGWREGGRDDWEAGWGKRSWDETCWRKYVQWTQHYRDVIAGSIFGHMNLDHFIVMDSQELDRKHKPKKGKKQDIDEPTFKVNSAEDYLISLREGFSRLPQPGPPKGKDALTEVDWNQKYIQDIGGEYGERFTVSVVGPSVVPNYFPTLRIIEYNITGIDHPHGEGDIETQEKAGDRLSQHTEGELKKRTLSETMGSKKKKPTAPLPNPPPPNSPPGPAYSNQPFTLLGYTQLYANLTRINAGRGKDSNVAGKIDNEFRYDVEYDTRTDKKYKLKDMTVRSYLELAHRLVDARKSGDQKKGKGGKHDKTTETSEGFQGDMDISFDDEEDEVEDLPVPTDYTSARRGRHHKGHFHRKGDRARDKVFKEFLNRAFVQTLSSAELDEILGIDAIDFVGDEGSDDNQWPPLVNITPMGVGRSRPLEFLQGECREGAMTLEDELEVFIGKDKILRQTLMELTETV